MKSVKYNNTFVTAMSQDGGVQCLGGMGLELLAETSKTQEWRNYEYGLVNVACGHSNGNLALTAIENDSFEKISYLDHVSFLFVNPFNDMAITGDVSGTVFLSQILLVVRLLVLT